MSPNALGARSGRAGGGALVRGRKLRSLDWPGKGDAHLVDEVARGDAVLSLEGRKPIFPRWSARLSSVETDEYERLSLGAILASRASRRSRVRASIAILFCGPQGPPSGVG
jgi:hypothetical protein